MLRIKVGFDQFRLHHREFTRCKADHIDPRVQQIVERQRVDHDLCSGQIGRVGLVGAFVAAIERLDPVFALGGALEDTMAENTLDEDQRVFAFLDHAGKERLHHAGAAHAPFRSGQGFPSEAVLSEPTRADLPFHHHPVGPEMVHCCDQARAIAIFLPQRGDGHRASRFELAQIALVGIPPNCSGWVADDYAPRGESVEPCDEILGVILIVPGRAEHDQRNAIERFDRRAPVDFC